MTPGRSRSSSVCRDGRRTPALFLALGITLPVLMQGCAHPSRGPVERLSAKPCAKLAGATGVSTESVYGALGVLMACGLAADAIDHPAPSEATLRAREVWDCPPIDEQALVPSVLADHALDVMVGVGSVDPAALGAVRVNLPTDHPYTCWLQTGIDAAVLRNALTKALHAAATTRSPTGSPFVVNAAILSQEESEDFHGIGNFTRKVRIAIRYSLTRPASTDEVWSELITTDMGVDYGLFASNPLRSKATENLFATVSRVAYERAIRASIDAMLQHLRSVALTE